MKKKIVSAILAGACAVSAMGLNVSAAVTNKNVTAQGAVTLTAAGTLLTPTINVSVPSTISAFVNPYGVGIANPNGTDYTADGVQSPTFTIISFTASSKILVKATPTVASTATVLVDDAGKTQKTWTHSSIYVASAKSELADPTNYVVLEKNDVNAVIEDALDADKTVKKAVYAKLFVVTADEGVAVDTTADTGNATVNKGVYTINLDKVPYLITQTGNDKYDPARYQSGSSAQEAVFEDGTLNTINNVKELAANKGTSTKVALIPQATKTGDTLAKYTYAQFEITGDVTPDSTLSSADSWNAKTDKLTFSVILDLKASAAADLASA